MSTLRITNIEAKADPSSPTVDEKIKLTNSNGDILVHIDGKTSGITTIGINTTAGNIKFDQNSNVVVTGIITATKFVGTIEPTSLEIGSNIKLGNAGVITATSYVGDGSALTGITGTTINNNADNRVITGSGTANTLEGEANLTYDGTDLVLNHATGDKAIRWATGGTNKWSLYHNNGSGALVAYDNANNAERLRITSAGTVNIGDQGLSDEYLGSTVKIRKDQNSVTRLSLRNENSGSGSASAIQVGAYGNSWMLQCGSAANDSNAFTIRVDGSANSNTGTERVRITSDGKMGVGCTPETDFQVRNGTGGTVKIGGSGSGATGFQIQYNNSGNTTTELLTNYRSTSGSASLKIDTGTFLVATGTSGAERLRITSGGDVGINNTAPADKLHVGGNIRFGTNTTYYGVIEHEAGVTGSNIYTSKDTGGHIFKTGTTPAEKVRIDNSGRILAGTTNSTGTQLLKINGDTSATTNGGHISLTQGRTSPGNGATHGVLSFGTETRPEVVKVVSFVDGTWTDGQYHPSGLYIATTDYNRNSPTEKIRITDSGEVNCYSLGSVIQAGTLQGGGYNVYFYEGRRNQNTGGTRTYIVWSNGNVENTNNSYGSISDQRLKENIVDATSQWDDIKSLQIRKYNFREATGNETHTQIGLIAQEVESVSPGLVHTTAVSEGDVLQDADGNQMESVKSINYSVLYMKSVKALQEAQTRIETLETQLTDALARITALEG